MNNRAKTLAVLTLFLPLFGSLQSSLSSSRPASHLKGPNHTSIAAHRKMNDLMVSDVVVHGLLLWSSMGFLMPAGILIIRLSTREKNKAMVRALFYVHVIVQILGLLLATTGAILSMKKFENTFDNLHQRIGLILYVAIWVQALTGLIRPRRGTTRRRAWYLGHWILGTTASLLGIVNVYTGITAYHDKIIPIKRTTKATAFTWVWNILFTVEVSSIAFVYLLIDKWDYIKRCGANESNNVPHNSFDVRLAIAPEVSVGKELVPIPCNKKSNALKNLFD